MQYAGRDFSKPELLSEAAIPADPGLYAIHVRTWRGNMKLLHFGASENLNEDLLVGGHEGLISSLGRSEARRGLWVSYHQAHDLDTQSRAHESSRLNRHYFPRRALSEDEHLAQHRIRRASEHRRTSQREASDTNDRIR